MSEVLDKEPTTSQRVNWDEVEQLFFRNPTWSVSELARHVGVSNPTIYKHATRRKLETRRRVFLREAHQEAIKRIKEEIVLEMKARYRALRRLVDTAIEDLTVRFDAAGAQYLLSLIAVEREIVDALPASESRNQELREHVEKALGIAGLPSIEEVA